VTDLERFREQTREWLEANCPLEMRQAASDDADYCWGGRNPEFKSSAQRHWLEAMAERGWTVPDWPTEYGGGGLSTEQSKILREEMARIQARAPLSSFGIWMLGPALLKFGSEEQKKLYLPQIAKGAIRWCQGYSEPGAGSDLVALQTFGEDKGGHWLVNGQKIWTSYADKADWIFCLVRTNKQDKYNGISFLLFDMTTPGISTRPILLISGRSPFCETFFDNVKVPKQQTVGEPNRGWNVAKYLLAREREAISGDALGVDMTSIGAQFKGIANSDPLLRADMAHLDVELFAFRAMSEKFFDEMRAGKSHPAQSSLLKYVGTELNKKRHELIMAAVGSAALDWEGDSGGGAARAWLRTKANSIEGGTSEIMLGVIAKRILGLPGI
jgi:acyl-CoA dehydrogenase